MIKLLLWVIHLLFPQLELIKLNFYQKTNKENSIVHQQRINLIREDIDSKEIECAKIYEEWMKGNKIYK